MRTIGIIPARGGSKGVVLKNIRMLAGRPLVSYSIDAAKGSRMLTNFVTSTDDADISAIAKELGSPVLTRPSRLAADDTPMLDVVKHALATLERSMESFDFVVVLQPTTPRRTSADIDAALELLIESKADSVVSVYKVADHHPARMYRLVDGRLVPYEAEPPSRLRQQLLPVYHRNGAIYACRRVLIEAFGTLIGQDSCPFIMPREKSINIDDEMDLAFADFLIRRQERVIGD